MANNNKEKAMTNLKNNTTETLSHFLARTQQEAGDAPVHQVYGDIEEAFEGLSRLVPWEGHMDPCAVQVIFTSCPEAISVAVMDDKRETVYGVVVAVPRAQVQRKMELNTKLVGAIRRGHKVIVNNKVWTVIHTSAITGTDLIKVVVADKQNNRIQHKWPRNMKKAMAFHS